MIVVVAALVSACGGADAPDHAATTFQPAGAPYAFDVPPGLSTRDVAPYDHAIAGGTTPYATEVGGAAARDATAVLLAIPVGEQLPDDARALARRFELATRNVNNAGGGVVGATTPWTVGGHAGFRLAAADATTEYRGAAVGTWFVLETCQASTVAARRRACDAVDRTLRLRAAPPPPASPGGRTVTIR